MADGKKSVLLYCDLIHTVEKMDNETAGLFFKHYLRYINDLNPTTDNLIVDITFESVKQNLKRDLLKWESRADNSRNNGKLGGRPKKEETQKTQQVNLKPEKPVNVTVTDTVNVNDNVNDTKADKIDFDALLFFINETFGRNFKTISNQVKAKYNVRLKDGYSKSDFKTAMLNCSKLQFHKDNNFQYCTPEYFSRAEILDKYSDVTEQEQAKETEFDLYTDSVMKKVAIAKSFQK